MQNPLTLQDARKLAKEGFRELYATYTGNPAWWTMPEPIPTAVRKAVMNRARAVLEAQARQMGGRVEVAQVVEVPAQAPVVEPPLPQVEAEKPKVVEPIELVALRAKAWELFPSDPSQSSKSKHNKAQADLRRKYLVANGAPRKEPKEGHVAFGRKFVGGVWVKA